VARSLNAILVLGLAAALPWAPLRAQSLNDPTRPPGAEALGASGAQDADQAGRLQLQSVLLSPHRKLAVINGQTFKLGESVGEAKLIAISETGVVLRQGEESKALALVPGIQKSFSKRTARGQKEEAKK
jgi:MSHA biogenesis protein MshK